MNRKISSIMKINDEKETWRIVVWVVNMRNIPRSPKYTIEMILMDDKEKCICIIFFVDLTLYNIWI